MPFLQAAFQLFVGKQHLAGTRRAGQQRPDRSGAATWWPRGRGGSSPAGEGRAGRERAAPGKGTAGAPRMGKRHRSYWLKEESAFTSISTDSNKR